MMTDAPAMGEPPVVEFRVCEGEGGCRTPKPVTEFPSNGRGGRRNICGPCYSARQVHLRQELHVRGMRKCEACKEVKPLEEFGVYGHRRGAEQTRQVCAVCEREGTPTLDEWETDMRDHGHQRWARALTLVLQAAGLTLQDFRALRGASRAVLEEAWTRVMRELAIAEGEWKPEWDEAARTGYVEGARAGGETRKAARAAA